MLSKFFEIRTSHDPSPFWSVGDGDGVFLTGDGPVFVTTVASLRTADGIAMNGNTQIRLERICADAKTGLVFLRPRRRTSREDLRAIICAKFVDIYALTESLSTEVLRTLLNGLDYRRAMAERKKKRASEKNALFQPLAREERLLSHPLLGTLEITEHAATRITEHLIQRRVLQKPDIAEDTQEFTFWSIRKGVQFLAKQLERAMERKRRNHILQTLKYKKESRYFVNFVDQVVLVITALGEDLHQLNTAYFKTKEELKSLYA